MSLLDTVDGAFMNFAYGWAFSQPVRNVFYNITITALSVAVALIIGMIELLAVFDKPDPLEGPYFEETIFTTPSRLPADVVAAVVRTTADACAALGLREGPVHAELRTDDERVWMLELATRSVGGLCSRSLRFGVGVSLEEVILRHALGLPLGDLRREAAASGVMMLRLRSLSSVMTTSGWNDSTSAARLGA